MLDPFSQTELEIRTEESENPIAELGKILGEWRDKDIAEQKYMKTISKSCLLTPLRI